ncbi:hypothetical protein Q7P37_004479 [Cladosporium fusiforme]
MSPRSMFGLVAAGLAAFAPLASAYTTPTGTEPKGNPISQPGLNSIVDVDSAFTITWEPTTEGTVSLVLLKGPAENLVPVYAIAEEIENSGSYSWDPKKTLEPSEGAKGYGIQLIDDKTGQYQYTTQFGISNEDYSEGQEETKESTSAAAYAAPSSKAAVSSAAPADSYPVQESAPTQADAKATALPVVTESASAGLPEDSAIVQPTSSMTVPATMSTMAAPYPTGSNHTSNGTTHNNSTGNHNIEASTGGASNMAASIGGLVIAAGVAVFAL